MTSTYNALAQKKLSLFLTISTAVFFSASTYLLSWYIYETTSSFGWMFAVSGIFSTLLLCLLCKITDIYRTKLQKLNRRQLTRRLCIACCAGIVGLAILPPAIPYKNSIEIEGLSHKNPKSSGYEIKCALYDKDLKHVPFDEFEQISGKWLFRGGRIISNSNSARTLSLQKKFLRKDNYTLIVQKSSWGGVARLNIFGKVLEYDLYSPSGNENIKTPVKTAELIPMRLGEEILLSFAQVLVMWYVVFFLLCLAITAPLKSSAQIISIAIASLLGGGWLTAISQPASLFGSAVIIIFPFAVITCYGLLEFVFVKSIEGNFYLDSASFKQKALLMMLSLIAACLLYCGTYMDWPLNWLFLETPWLSRLLLYSFCFFVVGLLVLCQRPEIHRSKSAVICGFLCATIVAAVLGLWFIAYYPAYYSPDSLYQWAQVYSGIYGDNHPVFCTLSWKFCSLIWNTPAAVITANVLSTAVVTGWGVMVFRRYGAPLWILIFSSLGVCALPLTGMITVSLWKDALFTASFIALTIFIVRPFLDSKYRTFNWKRVALLSVLMFLLCSYRHNGLYVLFAFLPIWLLVSKGWRKQVFLSFLIFAVVFFSANRFVYPPLVKVENHMKYSKGWMVLQHLIAHQHAHTKLTPEEEKLFREITYDYSLKWSPDTWSVLMGQNTVEQLRSNMYIEKLPQMLKLYMSLFLRNPNVSIGQILRGGSVAWKTHTPYIEVWCWDYSDRARKRYETYSEAPGWRNEIDRIAPANIAPNLRSILNKLWLYAEDMPYIGSALQRSGTYAYLMLFMLALSCIKRWDLRISAIFAPVLINQAIILLIAPGPKIRYVYSTIVLFFVLLPILFTLKKVNKGCDCPETKTPDLQEKI